jgi:hypothetical protein
MKHSRAAIGTAILTSALTSVALLAPPAQAATTVDVITAGLAGPLQMDLDQDAGRLVVAESFAGLLTEVDEDGTKTVLHQAKNSEVSGVAVEGDEVAFLTTRNNERNPGAFLKLLTAGGVDKVADLLAFETEENPDQFRKYGFMGLDKSCKRKLPKNAGVRPYRGIVESHPYALAEVPGGGWYVADAAGNSILEVTPYGEVSTVAVLPRQRAVVTKAGAEANGFPKCVAGETFAFESVPTDVEVDDDGQLVVSLLPGGPEDPSLGARGSVVRVDPATGRSTEIAKGFASATNVALDGDVIYVSELFGDKITAIDGDNVTTYRNVPTPTALESVDGTLLATVNVFGKKGGRLIAIEQSKVS